MSAAAQQIKPNALPIPQPPPKAVPSMTGIQRLVAEHTDIDLESLPDTFMSTGNFDHPIVDEKERFKELVAHGKTYKIPFKLSIQDVNKNRFSYTFLDEEAFSKPEFAGYRIVTRNSPARFSQDQQLKIPDAAFAGNECIMRGNMVYAFCKVGFSKQFKEASQNKADRSLAKYAPEVVEADFKDGSGKSNGRLVHSKLDANMQYMDDKKKT